MQCLTFHLELGGTYNKGMGQPSISIWYQVEDGEAWGFQPMGNPKPHQTISALDATRCSPPVPGRQAVGEGQSETGCWWARQAPSPSRGRKPKGQLVRGEDQRKLWVLGPGLSVAVH